MVEIEELNLLTDEEFYELEREIDKQTAAWNIQNLRGKAAIYHDDQRIGLPKDEVHSIKHPSVNIKALNDFRMKPVVDNVEGNMLVHPLTTPVIVVNDNVNKSRSTWWSIGLESLSKFREKPMPILSLGMIPGTEIKEDDQWRILWGEWQRTTKNDYTKGWVDSMIPTNTRPALTPAQDRSMLGKYAYQKHEARKPVPIPPEESTWKTDPDETNESWLTTTSGNGKKS